jgi:hypothetical protein
MASFGHVAAVAAGLAMVYAKSGISGTAESTVQGRKYALAYFDTFLESKNMVRNSLDNTTLTENLFREYGTFLADYARDKSGDPISQGTALQYFSGVKTFYQLTCSGFDVFKYTAVVDAWNTSIREGIRDSISRRCIAEGVPICDKAPLLGK